MLYVSNCWGGRASDKKITMESGLLDKLNAGQDVMADRGFDISVHLETVGMELHIPSFLGTKRMQLRAEEVMATRWIAEVRVQIEQAIERIKEFQLLQGDVDISLLHVIEQIFQTCTFLVKFQRPIVNDVVYMS